MFLFSTAGAQDTDAQKESENQRIYTQMYNSALSDSVISEDERKQLEILQQLLGLNADIVDEILESPVLPLEPKLDQSGRWTLVAQNMIWGSTLYGIGIPTVLDLDDSKWYIGGFMFGFGGALVATWNYTSDLYFPEARSQLQRSGGAIGLHYAVTLSRILDLEFRGTTMMSMAAVPAGLYVGDRLFKKLEPTTGMAYAMSMHAELGRAIGAIVHRQISPPPPEPPGYDEFEFYDPVADEAYENELEQWLKPNHMFQITGYPIGFYFGQRYFGQRDYSFGDALLIFVGRWGGAFYGLIIADLFNLDFDESKMAWRWMIMGGGVGGLFAMDRWIDEYNFTFGQGFLMSLGAVAGAGFAAGTGLIMEIDEPEFYKITTMAAAIGGMAWVKNKLIPSLERASSNVYKKNPVQLSIIPSVGPGLTSPGLSLQLRW